MRLNIKSRRVSPLAYDSAAWERNIPEMKGRREVNREREVREKVVHTHTHIYGESMDEHYVTQRARVTKRKKRPSSSGRRNRKRERKVERHGEEKQKGKEEPGRENPALRREPLTQVIK